MVLGVELLTTPNELRTVLFHGKTAAGKIAGFSPRLDVASRSSSSVVFCIKITFNCLPAASVNASYDMNHAKVHKTRNLRNKRPKVVRSQLLRTPASSLLTLPEKINLYR